MKMMGMRIPDRMSFLLEFDSGHAGKAGIEQEAARVILLRSGDELFG